MGRLCGVTPAFAQATHGLLRDARASASRIDHALGSYLVLHRVAEVQSIVGDIEDALDTARSIGHLEHRTMAVWAVGRNQAEAGDVEGALDPASPASGGASSTFCARREAGPPH